MRSVLEVDEELQFVRLCQAFGLEALKFKPPGSNGWPDRIVLLPGAVVLFFEFKKPGEVPRRLQEHRHAYLRSLGFKVYAVDDAATAVGHVRRALEAGARAEARHEVLARKRLRHSGS